MVPVGELLFLAPFYVIRTKDYDTTEDSQVLLGRSFMVTTWTEITAWTGELAMEVDGESMTFIVHESIKYPPDTSGFNAMNVIDEAVI